MFWQMKWKMINHELNHGLFPLPYFLRQHYNLGRVSEKKPKTSGLCCCVGSEPRSIVNPSNALNAEVSLMFMETIV